MSQPCINYNCTDELGTRLLNSCGYERQGGASAILFIECGSSLANPASGTDTNTLISAGNAQLITGVNVSWDYGSVVEVDSNVPCSSSRVVNVDRELTIVDRNLNAQSIAFWDSVLKGRRFGGLVVYECGNEEQQRVRYIQATVTFSGSDRFPNNSNDFQDIKATGKWRSLSMPSMFNYPVGVAGLI